MGCRGCAGGAPGKAASPPLLSPLPPPLAPAAPLTPAAPSPPSLQVVRAFHRFTLVDQTGQGRDLTKGRTRDAGAVKISCARQDPNARNCHGYRKFVKRTILEDPSKGYLMNDTIIIKYTIELVVSSGGALSRGTGSKSELVKVPAPSMGADLGTLLASGSDTDCVFEVEGEEMRAHKIILEARSPVFRALLNSPMREGQEGRVVIEDMKVCV
jgi:speckle-type POZ protein